MNHRARISKTMTENETAKNSKYLFSRIQADIELDFGGVVHLDMAFTTSRLRSTSISPLLLPVCGDGTAQARMRRLEP